LHREIVDEPLRELVEAGGLPRDVRHRVSMGDPVGAHHRRSGGRSRFPCRETLQGGKINSSFSH